MNKKSPKAKGNRFERHLVEVLRENLDSKAYRTAGSGSGLDKNDIRIPNFNIEIEAKNATEYHIPKDWEQTKRQLTSGNLGVLVIRNPKEPEFKESLVVMDLYDWIELVKKQKDEVQTVTSFNPNDKWLLKNLIDNCKKVIKKYEKSGD